MVDGWSKAGVCGGCCQCDQGLPAWLPYCWHLGELGPNRHCRRLYRHCLHGGSLTRRWRPTVPLLAFTGWQLLIGGLFLLPVGLIDPPLPPLKPYAVAGLCLSLFGALLAYVLWFRGIARLAPVAVSSLGLLSPLVAVTLGWALLGRHHRRGAAGLGCGAGQHSGGAMGRNGQAGSCRAPC